MKFSKKHGIIVGSIIGLVFIMAVVADTVVLNPVKDKVMDTFNNDPVEETAPAVEESATPLPADPAVQSQITVDNGSKKLSS